LFIILSIVNHTVSMKQKHLTFVPKLGPRSESKFKGK